MCTNYTPTARDRFKAAQLGVLHWPENDWPSEVYPGYEAPIVTRTAVSATTTAVRQSNQPLSKGQFEVQLARFGLVPRWCRDTAHASAVAKGTYNARSETVTEKPSFRGAWRDRMWALVPMDSYFDPCWETGHAVRWRIGRTDGAPMACAGVWERWRDPAGTDVVTSFSLLTVNSDHHPLTRRMHRVGDEKRMPVIVNPADFDAWLRASPQDAVALIHGSAEIELIGEPAPKALKPRQGAMPKTPGKSAVAKPPKIPVPTTGDLFQW